MITSRTAAAINLVALSALIAFLVHALIILPRPWSSSLLLQIDDRPYFTCFDAGGCWFMLLSEHSWPDLAFKLGADETKLRAANPQVTGGLVAREQLILFGAGMKATVRQ